MATPAVPLALNSCSTFGDLLKYLRRSERLTQFELSIAVGYSEAQISRLEKNQRLPDLTAIKALFLPALHLEHDPELATRLLELAQSSREEDAPARGAAPYKGLLFFDESDADLFFGREALTERLVERVNALPAAGERCLLAVVGASGSGKSSVLRAGLSVALKRAGWETRVFTPTAQPLTMLKKQLADRHVNGETNASRVLWVVDQFEELFTLCRDEAARAAFVEGLLAAATSPASFSTAENDLSHVRRGTGGEATVVIALRADFYSHCAQFPQLRQAIAAQQEYIGQMSVAELRRAIEEPAKRGGWEFEPGLVDLMLRDVNAGGTQDQEPGALPLLSHALLATWERRRGRTFTLDGYWSSRGVRGAIAETAESVFTDQFNAQQRDIARGIFLRLTELGEGTEDTRRRATLTELVSRAEDAHQVRAVLNTLADARLVSLGADSAEVAHEALIREWQRLRDWLNSDREGLRLRRHLTEAAHEWELLQREPGALYRGAHLAQAKEWAAANPQALNAQERAFLDASQEWAEREVAEREAHRQRELESTRKLAEEQQRRAEEQGRAARDLRRRAYFLATAFSLALVSTFIALYFGQQARASAVTAEQEGELSFARELASSAIANLDVDPERSLLLAMRSLSVTQTFEGRDALGQALLASHIRLALRGHTGKVHSAAFSPDDRYIVTAGFDGTSRVWDAASGQVLLVLRGHTGKIYSAAFNSSGKQIVTASDDQTARVWDGVSGQPLLVLRGHTGVVITAAYSPDGKHIVTASDDQTARVWDTVSGQSVLVLRGHDGAVISAVFSPDGKYIVTSSLDRTARVWDAVSGRVLLILSGHTAGLLGATFSPDGKQIVTASDDGTARLWDAASGRVLFVLYGHTSGVYNAAFSLDGKQIVTAGNDRTARVWDAANGQSLLVLRGHTAAVSTAAFSADGKQIVTASNDGTARVWDAASEEAALLLQGHTGPVSSAAFGPDGKNIVTASQDGTARVWDATTGGELVVLRGHNGPVGSAAFSLDGKRIATASQDGTARGWDAATGRSLFVLRGHTGKVYSAAFSPDGKHIVTTGDDQTARLWDGASGQPLLVLRGHTGKVNNAAFSPDGMQLVTASDDRSVRVWDVNSGQALLVLNGHSGVVNTATFSPDGKQVVSASNDQTARLWDAANGHELTVLRGHTDAVFSASFSPDGREIVTAGKDRTVRVWDADSGRLLFVLHAQTTGVNSAAFSPDGKYILAAGPDGTGRVYLAHDSDLVAFAQTRVTRDLACDEREIFLHQLGACPTPTPVPTSTPSAGASPKSIAAVPIPLSK